MYAFEWSEKGMEFYMKKEIIIFIIVLFLCTGAVVGIYCYNKLNKRTYSLELPIAEEISNITLEKNTKYIDVNNSQEIKNIVEILEKTKRTTKKESIQDMPVNVENEIKINFKITNNEIKTIFVYKRKNKYYIEQPYNGIYEINQDEYNSIEKYIK